MVPLHVPCQTFSNAQRPGASQNRPESTKAPHYTRLSQYSQYLKPSVGDIYGWHLWLAQGDDKVKVKGERDQYGNAKLVRNTREAQIV